VEWVVSDHEDVTLRVSVVVMLTSFPDLSTTFNSWLHIRYDYLLNLSILISRGKETNWDTLSNGE
jgi:hypothetical protein